MKQYPDCVCGHNETEHYTFSGLISRHCLKHDCDCMMFEPVAPKPRRRTPTTKLMNASPVEETITLSMRAFAGMLLFQAVLAVATIVSVWACLSG